MNEPTQAVAGAEESGSAKAVRDYYDQFFTTRGEQYLREGNARIDKAIDRVLPYVHERTRALDLGCGIGLVTERIAHKAKDGHVWACDISENNVTRARERVALPNIDFRSVDIVRSFDLVSSWLPKPVDLIVMIDVIEHIPLQEHEALLRNLRSVMARDATLVLTYPSPEYQRYLMERNPGELQIIDEVVEIPRLLEQASLNGMELQLFSLEDVWLKNQYVHCVFKTSVALWPVEETEKAKDGLREIAAVVGVESFVLIDEDQWRSFADATLKPLPFLGRDGEYWGAPADDAAAIAEFEQLTGSSGAMFVAIAQPAFWWLEHYPEFARNLDMKWRRLLDNDLVVVFGR